MTILWGMTLLELLAASLFVLTAVLLVYATAHRYRETGRLCAIAAILSVCAANVMLLTSYAGEPAVQYERPGPIKQNRSGERGTFAFEKADENGSGHSAASGTGAGSVVMASASSGADSGRAESQLLRAFDGCPNCPDMVVIRPGVFTIGAAQGDTAAEDSERPTRTIGIARPFAIGRNEVTLGEYSAFLAATGRAMPECPDFVAAEDDPRLPATCVSAREADSYAAWLAAKTGRPFRLPSEAEWEYAARAGATGAYATGEHIGLGDANIERPHGLTVRVGSYPANAFGVNDMHGNAAEIVAGCWTVSPSLLPGDGAANATPACTRRVVRDGHAGEPVTMTRLSARRPINVGDRRPGVGFRLARDLQ
ncbi:MAG: SUMF1/EgtB/PvdO family nonheme iron enzyme [Hyphomicrobiaceae bacterium]